MFHPRGDNDYAKYLVSDLKLMKNKMLNRRLCCQGMYA